MPLTSNSYTITSSVVYEKGLYSITLAKMMAQINIDCTIIQDQKGN